MNTYKEMNEKIVEILRLSDEPTCLYAAQRIEELEQENSRMIDRVLEIINRRIVIQEMKYTEANDILQETIAEIRATEVKEIRNEILELWRDKE